MKNYSPAIIALLALVGAIITAICAVNGLFVGKARLLPVLCVIWLCLFSLALFLIYHPSGPRPRIVPTAYGSGPSSPRKIDGRWCRPDGTPFSTEEILRAKHQLGHHGLLVVNDGEPAYELSVADAEVPIGTSRLNLSGHYTRLAKGEGERFFPAVIRLSDHTGTLGSGLFDEMREKHVDHVNVAVKYKDQDNRWYKTICQIERDVLAVGGLSVHFIRQRRMWWHRA